ncbi:PQ-loop repeat-containing protein 1 isoform X1 [Lingula anatina]|uniref:Solute carrier family 66 member 2 n=1 Tax=Lingula anatina TaxID=7574 RepID=A0A1S3HB32_LINAN|nr:PQ-loop repeat-containing protein 1 isoform X1 [Lingula anatina]|eukprot:XP_013382671.1 PQ-loop repeat-containing protein 1 isoform X1 [Lingula anatina]
MDQLDLNIGQLKDLHLPEITLLNLISWTASGAMIFGGVVPFIPQYRDIRRTMNADGFSTFVCLTLLIANILRILFWFGKHFELPLLAQSIVMIFCMLSMIELCVRVKNRSEILQGKPRTLTESKRSRSDEHINHADLAIRMPHQNPVVRTLTDFELQYFWRWTDFGSYIEFLLLFSLLVGFITYICIDIKIVIEFIGFSAVFAEAMLGAPQFHRNWEKKSTIGMSIKMVSMWTCGDVFKTVYFILREAPPQFWICGLIQVSIDIGILFQVWYYRHYPQLAKPAVQ